MSTIMCTIFINILINIFFNKQNGPREIFQLDLSYNQLCARIRRSYVDSVFEEKCMGLR